MRRSGPALLGVVLAAVMAAAAFGGASNVQVTPVSAQAGTQFSGQVATFQHTGKEDSNRDATATISWGDGSTTAGTVTPDPCEFCENTTSRVSGSHTYAQPGSYTLKVTVQEAGSPAVSGTGTATVSSGPTATATATATTTPAPSTTPPPPPPPACVDLVKVGIVRAIIPDGTGAPACFTKEPFTYKANGQTKQGNRYLGAAGQPVMLSGFMMIPSPGCRAVLEPATGRIYRRTADGKYNCLPAFLGLVHTPPGANGRPTLPPGDYLAVTLKGKFGGAFDPQWEVPAGSPDSLVLGTISVNGQGNPAERIAGFPMVGDVPIRVFKDGHAEVPVLIELPETLGGYTAPVTLKADNARGLYPETIENLTIGPLTVMVPPGLKIIEFADLKLTLGKDADGALTVWKGTGRLRLPAPLPADLMESITGGSLDGATVVFQGAKLVGGGVSIKFPQLIPIATGLFLSRLGLGFADTAAGLQINGNHSIGLVGGGDYGGKPLFNMENGDIALTFGKGDAPALTVDLSTGTVDVIGVPTGQAHARLSSAGTFAFDADYTFEPFPPFYYHGQVDGWVDVPKTKFNFSAIGDGCLPYCTTARGVLSSTGIAVCGGIDLWLTSIEVGFGYKWGASLPNIMAPSCDFGPYSATVTRLVRVGPFGALGPPGLRQTQQPNQTPTATRVVELEGKRKAVSFGVRGVNAPPKLRVTIVDTGESIVTDLSDKGQIAGSFNVTRDDLHKTTHVAIAEPPSGEYRFEPLEGSAIKRIDRADVLAIPEIEIKKVKPSGKVGPGGVEEFVIPYLVDPLESDTYTFLESGAGFDKVLKTLTGKQLLGAGGPAARAAAKGKVRGKLRFTPTPMRAGRRKIKVLVESHGLPRKTLTIGSYVAPAPPRPAKPRRLRARLRGRRLVITWKRVRGAVRTRAEVELSDGRKLLRLTRGRRVVVRRVARRTRGIVSVVGLRRDNRAGPRAVVRLKR